MGATTRADTSSLISGKTVAGVRGLGVLGANIPSTGTSGPGILYNDIDPVTEADDEFRALLLSVPSGGTFFMWEDSSFTATGYADGSYSGTYEGFKNGVSYGTATYSFTIGAGSSFSTSGALSADDATVAGSATHLTLHTSSGALTAVSASISGSANHSPGHVASGNLSAQAAAVVGSATRFALHETSGALAADSASIDGIAAQRQDHLTEGAFAAGPATIAGTATHISLNQSTSGGGSFTYAKPRKRRNHDEELLLLIAAFLHVIDG